MQGPLNSVYILGYEGMGYLESPTVSFDSVLFNEPDNVRSFADSGAIECTWQKHGDGKEMTASALNSLGLEYALKPIYIEAVSSNVIDHMGVSGINRTNDLQDCGLNMTRQPCEPPPQATRVREPRLMVDSLGSEGHPYTCAQSCRYVKRKGGCRDGVDCLFCHHCFWTREKARQEEAENQPPAVPKDETFPVEVKVEEVDNDNALNGCPSLGTVGHPLLCGSPCKYFGRPRGCKDGLNCERCHACKWTIAARKGR